MVFYLKAQIIFYKRECAGVDTRDDPLEAAVFSVLVETLKRQDQIESCMREDVDR